MVSPIDNVDLITGGALSVGFQSVEQIKPLGDLMRLIFKESFFNVNKDLDAIGSDLKKRNNEDKKHNAKVQEELNKIHKSSEETVEKLHTISAETRKGFETFLSIGKTTANVITKALSNHVKQVVDLSNTFRGIESSGVYVKEGFNTLFDTARATGMSMEELAGHLKSSAPLIAKLNSSVGDGVKTFKNSLSKISKDYNLTRSEEVAAFSSTIENLTPSQLRQMKEDELIKRVDETARQMKMLSLATGKSVEQIKEEQDAKAQTMRAQVWQRTNKDAYRILQTLGLNSTEMIDYFASGGTRITPEIAMQMAGDELTRNLIPEMIKLQRVGALNTDSLASLQNKYRHLGERRLSQTASNVNNAGLYSAMSVSSLAEHYGANEVLAQNFLNNDLGMLKGNMASESEGRKESNKLLRGSEELSRTINNINTSIKELETGGVKGMNLAINSMQNITKPAEKVTEVLAKIASSSGDIGGGILGSVLTAGGTAFGAYLGSRTLGSGLGKAGSIYEKIRGRKKGRKTGPRDPKTGRFVKKPTSKLGKLGKVVSKKGLGKATSLLGAGLVRKIPILGFGLSARDAFSRAKSGDWLGAGGELLSGALSTLPGVGTMASLALSTALMARDSLDISGETVSNIKTPTNDKIENVTNIASKKLDDATSQSIELTMVVKSIDGKLMTIAKELQLMRDDAKLVGSRNNDKNS